MCRETGRLSGLQGREREELRLLFFFSLRPLGVGTGRRRITAEGRAGTGRLPRKRAGARAKPPLGGGGGAGWSNPPMPVGWWRYPSRILGGGDGKGGRASLWITLGRREYSLWITLGGARPGWKTGGGGGKNPYTPIRTNTIPNPTNVQSCVIVCNQVQSCTIH